jgi:hypothetical protein
MEIRWCPNCNEERGFRPTGVRYSVDVKVNDVITTILFETVVCDICHQETDAVVSCRSKNET